MSYLKIFLIISIFQMGCFPIESEENVVIKNYDFKEPKQFKISSKLSEISGLATSEGKLFAINDEIGIIYTLNVDNGEIIERFFLGKWTAEADFEGLAINKKKFYAISSNGTLYIFNMGGNEQAVDYEIVKLPFSSKFDIEGLYYDKNLNGLLIAAKEYPGKNNRGTRSIFLYDLASQAIGKEPKISISLKTLNQEYGIKDFYPSGISKHPIRKTLFIISARDQNALVEVDYSGEIIGVQKLSEKRHRQPEGIAFLDDGTLIISDEAAGKKPTLTIYNYQK